VGHPLVFDFLFVLRALRATPFPPTRGCEGGFRRGRRRWNHGFIIGAGFRGGVRIPLFLDILQDGGRRRIPVCV